MEQFTASSELILQAKALVADTVKECYAALPATAKALVPESEVVSTKERLSNAKHSLIDLQTRKSVAESLALVDPFSRMDTNKNAVAQEYSVKRAEMKAKKAVLEATHEEIANVAEQVSTLYEENLAFASKITENAAAVEAVVNGGYAGASTMVVQVLSDRADPGGSLAAVTVTVVSETEARAVISEQTVLAATLHSTATGAAVAAAAARGRVPAVEAGAAALQRELAEVRAQREERVRAVVTQAQLAVDAAAHFDALHATLAGIFGAEPPTDSHAMAVDMQ